VADGIEILEIDVSKRGNREASRSIGRNINETDIGQPDPICKT